MNDEPEIEPSEVEETDAEPESEDSTPQDEPAEWPEERVGDADAALERLAQMKDPEPESSRRTPYWIGVVALIAVIGFLSVFPALLDGGATDAERLKQALAYCKYRDDQSDCEKRIRARYEVCVERHETANNPDFDTYGHCMTQEFPNFYLTAGYNGR